MADGKELTAAEKAAMGIQLANEARPVIETIIREIFAGIHGIIERAHRNDTPKTENGA